MAGWAVAWLALAAPLPAQTPALPAKPIPIANAINEIDWYSRLLASHHRELQPQAAIIVKATAWLGKKLSTHEPAAYALQLTADDYLLKYAVDHPAQAGEITEAVAQDLSIKDRDCEQHGHGRLVPVEVHTVKGGTDAGGWQVFYQWVPPTPDFAPAQMSFPALSSPTSMDLPPGLYRMHAEKTGEQGASLKSETVNVPVGGAQNILWKIPVP